MAWPADRSAFELICDLRMPPALHRRIALEARRQGQSVNRYIIDRLKLTAAKTG